MKPPACTRARQAGGCADFLERRSAALHDDHAAEAGPCQREVAAGLLSLAFQPSFILGDGRRCGRMASNKDALVIEVGAASRLVAHPAHGVHVLRGADLLGTDRALSTGPAWVLDAHGYAALCDMKRRMRSSVRGLSQRGPRSGEPRSSCISRQSPAALRPNVLSAIGCASMKAAISLRIGCCSMSDRYCG